MRETKAAAVTISGRVPGRNTLKVGLHLAGKAWKEWKPEQAF